MAGGEGSNPSLLSPILLLCGPSAPLVPALALTWGDLVQGSQTAC